MEQYLGMQPVSVINQMNSEANRINAQNFAADRDFWAKINQMFHEQNLAKQQSGYAQELAGINNSAALEQLQNKLQTDQMLGQLQADTSRYGVDKNTEAQKYNADQTYLTNREGFQNQLDLAGINNQGQNYRAGLEAQTASLSPLLKQERFNAVMPLFSGLLGGLGKQMFGDNFSQAMAPQGQQVAAQPQGFAQTGQGLPPWAPPPGTPNSFWTDLYLQQKLSNPNAVYGGGGMGGTRPGETASPAAMAMKPMGVGPNGEPMGIPQMQQAAASYQAPAVQQIPASQVGSSGGSSSSSSSSSGGGSSNSSSAPQIGINPPSSPQNWNQQVNKQIGLNNQNMATQNNQVAQNYGSRYGTFGKHGIGQMDKNNARLAGLNQDARIQIPMQGQKAYSDYMLNAQTAQANQWNNQQQLGIQKQNANNSLFSPLLSALTGLAG